MRFLLKVSHLICVEKLNNQNKFLFIELNAITRNQISFHQFTCLLVLIILLALKTRRPPVHFVKLTNKQTFTRLFFACKYLFLHYHKLIVWLGRSPVLRSFTAGFRKVLRFHLLTSNLIFNQLVTNRIQYHFQFIIYFECLLF